MSANFEILEDRTTFEGRIVTVRSLRVRYEDGAEADRELVGHMGAVAVVAHDDENLWLVRQPREPIGVPDLIELPAGKLDEEGESPLETGKRELVEEIGKAADHWEHLKTYWSSPGFSDEQVHVYLATGLRDAGGDAHHEDERIDVVTWPLADLDGLIDLCTDAKTVIGLFELRRRRETA